MTVIPLKSAELGRWRLAISAMVLRLSFGLDRLSDPPRLLVQLRDGPSLSQSEELVGRALIQLDKALAPDGAIYGTYPNAALNVALGCRARMLARMSENIVPMRPRHSLLQPINDGLAYADALGAVLKTMVESDGPDAIRALVKANPIDS